MSERSESGRRVVVKGSDAFLLPVLKDALDRAGFERVTHAPDVVLFAPSRAAAADGLDRALTEVLDAGRAALDDALAHGVPLLVISSLDVVGGREGILPEGDPALTAYPLAHRRGKEAWRPDDEVEVLRTLSGQAAARLGHADRQSRHESEARASLRANKEPTARPVVDDAAARARAATQRAAQRAAADERAHGWGFPTATGLVFALLEQTLAARGHPVAFLRAPALGACRDHPAPGFCVDAAPLALDALWAKARAGQRRFALEADARVELLPADVVADAAAALVPAVIAGRVRGVVHASATADDPLSARRLVELMDLFLRQRERAEGGRALPRTRVTTSLDLVAAHPLPRESARALSTGLGALARFGRRAPGAAGAALARATTAARKVADGFGRPVDGTLVDGPPFLSPRQRLRAIALRRAGFAPSVDWRRYLLDTHLPTLEAARVAREAAASGRAPRRAFPTLGDLVREVAAREQSRPALTRFVGDDVEKLSYKELGARARAVAKRLREAGVGPGDRVLIAGENHPAWPLCAFGALLLGATLVPCDPALDEEAARTIVDKARLTLALVDKKARGPFGPALEDAAVRTLDLALTATAGPGLDDGALPAVQPSDIASILFTSGTTGVPKGVMLSHENFTSLLASLGSVFDMHGDDRSLSLLPLHHTLEFSCGLLLPLSAGVEIHYLDALTGERLLHALEKGRITGMVGVPALWQLLERRVQKRVDERGDAFRAGFDAALSANRALGKHLGLDVGKLIFKPIHDELGGHLRTLISGGAALPAEVHALFAGLGLHLAEGYGLTETAPVLTVAEGQPGAVPGTVGHPIPGVTLTLDEDTEAARGQSGVGEVLAKGPNVMRGYFDNDAATAAAFTGDGWFRTGDLGRFDETGALVIVGRAKDVVVTAAGENVYLDDVEARIGDVPFVDEYALVGLPDPRGGERLALAASCPREDADAARAALDKALLKVPLVYRPSVIELFHEALPRTATRKVKRKAVVPLVEAALAAAAADRPDEEAPALAPVRQAIALVAGVDVGTLAAGTDLRADLGFDSLMWVELQGALEPLFGAVDADALFACPTVGHVEAFARDLGGAARAPARDDDDERALPAPAALVRPARAALATAQREVYRTLFQTEVRGRAHIPYNRPTIVVANHTSHLDTGLVKFALGSYGKDLAPLAAKDYFFEGNRAKVAFFEHLTNLVPIERESGSGKSFEQAVAAVQSGRVVLIFPEGTRRAEGTLGEFKPLVGRLSLTTGVDVLPLYLEGAFDALPRGSALPKGRHLRVHIGAPVEVARLRAVTAGQRPVDAARAATRVIHEAVAALRDGTAPRPPAGEADARAPRAG